MNSVRFRIIWFAVAKLMALLFFVIVPGLLLLQGAVAGSLCFFLFRLWMPLPLIAAGITFWWMGGKFTTSYPIETLLVFLLIPAAFGAFALITAKHGSGIMATAIAFVTMVFTNYLCAKSALSDLGYNQATYVFALSYLGLATVAPNLAAFLLCQKQKGSALLNRKGA